MVQETNVRATVPGRIGFLAVGAVTVASLAACSSTTNGTGTAARHAAGPVVTTLVSAEFGTILVSGGRTLYTLTPSSRACDSACTKIWPELLLPPGATTATAGAGVSAANLGTMDRGGGARQVTYSGQPLYFFAEDTAPGDAKGNITDVWGKWSVVVTASPAGAVVPAPTTTPTTSAPAAAPVTTSPAAPLTTSPSPPTTSAPPPPTTAPPAPTTTAPAGGGGAGF